MAVVQIPLQKVPAQRVAVALAGQKCVIALRQLGGRQYFSLSINGSVICENVLIVDNSRIVRVAYKQFVGDFMAVDTRGSEPPTYSGWGDRWLLLFNPDA